MSLHLQNKPAPAQDERKTFEAWAKTQGDKWLIVGGLQWSAGTDDYASARTNAAWAAWQERAALSARPAQTEQQPAYVECRECTDCGHVGINDAHQTDATCAMCDWSGPSPVEDQCPDCGKENVMGAACPKCSGRYRILAETHVAAPIAQTAPQTEQSERWQSVTRPGQIDVGDWLSFTVGGCLICAKARDVLNPGTDREEVIYNRAKNYYFITRMAVDGSSSHKGVMRAAPCAHVGDT